jgi:hypothetical protein
MNQEQIQTNFHISLFRVKTQVVLNRQFIKTLKKHITQLQKRLIHGRKSSLVESLRIASNMLTETKKRINLLKPRYPCKQAEAYFEPNSDDSKLLIFLDDKYLFLKTLKKHKNGCMICFQNFIEIKSNDMNKMHATFCHPVSHIFCRKCIIKWIDSCVMRRVQISCPCCRTLLFS